jgi:hypothetical protein
MTRDELVESFFLSLIETISCSPVKLRAAVVEEVAAYVRNVDQARFFEDDDYGTEVWDQAHEIAGD